jgi:hypothetical protein
MFKLNLHQLAEMLKIPSWDECFENVIDNFSDAYVTIEREARAEGKLEDEAQELALRAETKAQDGAFVNYHTALLELAEEMFEHHALTLIPRAGKVGRKKDLPYEFYVRPAVDWNKSANEIRQTINGVGFFHFNSTEEFLKSGPYTARQATLEHLHWMIRWYDVYGEKSPCNRFKFDF